MVITNDLVLQGGPAGVRYGGEGAWQQFGRGEELVVASIFMNKIYLIKF